MANIPPSTAITFTCGQCGAATKMTIGEMQSGRPFTCKCGKTYDTAEMNAKAVEAIEKLKAKLGGLGG